jgi:F-type H+-transporting ATPase subunit delta
MKVSKTAASTARRLFGLCMVNGRLDEARLRDVVARLATDKPRDYRAILASLQRLTRLEVERRRVTVESAVELDQATRQRIAANLAGRYGPDLVTEYRINPELIGGLRMRVGNDVLDGSVKGRIDRLTTTF